MVRLGRSAACLVLLALGLVTTGRSQNQRRGSAETVSASAGRSTRGEKFVVRRRGGVPPGQRLARSYELALRRTAQQLAAHTVASSPWTAVGPGQVNTSRYGLVTGRVTSIAADPSDLSGNTVYVGATGGGVWLSTNAAGTAGQVSFAPLTDDLSVFAPPSVGSLSIGALTVQPGGTGVVLAGTGDPNDSSDSYYGVGILRSADHGQSWTQITTADIASPGPEEGFIGVAFAGFAWNGANPSHLVAAVTDTPIAGAEDTVGPTDNAVLGLYYSTDAGQTWNLATLSDGGTVIQSNSIVGSGGNAATSVVWNPVRQKFYAAIRYHGYYESADGQNWTRLANQPGVNLSTAMCPANPTLSGSTACPIYRGAIAVQPQTGDMFAITVDQYNNDQGVWQDVCTAGSNGCANAGVQFANQIADSPIDLGSTGTIANAVYNLSIAAVPSQADTLLFVGTQDLFRCSLYEGCAWRNTTNVTGCAAAGVAPSQHAIESTFAESGLLYFGNDGGLWRTTDAVNQQQAACGTDDAAHFQNLNSGLGSLAEVSDLAVSSTGTVLAAMGQLGTAAGSSDSVPWAQVLDGEGDHVAIDPNNSQNWFATSSPGIAISECTEGEGCTSSAFQPVIGAGQVGAVEAVAVASPPWMLDPVDSTQMLVGTCRVWRGAADGAGWSMATSPLSGMLDGDQQPYCDGNAVVSSLGAGAAANGAERFFAGMANQDAGGGLAPGHIYSDLIDLPSTGPVGWADLTESPVTNSSSPRFNPAGLTVSSIYVDPHDTTGNTIYATIQGFANSSQSGAIVYGSTDGGLHWQGLSDNLPIAPANSVVVDPNDANTVYVATDAGVWVTRTINLCVNPAQGCWSLMGTGLPNAPVTKLVASTQGSQPTLYAATYGRGVWQTGLLAVAAIAAGTVNPTTLNFPDQKVQTLSAPLTVTVKSTGTAPLTVSGYQATGDFQAAQGACQAPLPSGNTCTISITFTPSATGQRSGQLIIFADVPGGQFQVSLAGAGTVPGTIVTSPSSLSFGQAPIGTTTSSQSVTISNVGTLAATISQISVSGDFSLTLNTCGTQLAPQTGCSVSLVFSPTASGNRTGQLIVVDPQGTQEVPLSGTGQSLATDIVAPTNLTFGPQQVSTPSAAQAVTLSNGGDAPLNLISETATGDFTVVNDCGAILAGHSTCSMLVTFTPTAVGGRSGSLNITDALGTHPVTLVGTGLAGPGVTVAPNAVNFGGYGAGATSPTPQTITMTNNGGVVLSGITASLAGASAFTITANSCTGSQLGVGDQCNVTTTFSPRAAGPASGSLIVRVASSSQTYTVPLSGYGDDFALADSGTNTQTITSGSTATYSLTATPLAGTTGPISFSCSGAPQASTCAVSSTQGTLNGQTAYDFNVTVTTGLTTTAADWRRGAGMVLAFSLPWLFYTRNSARCLSRAMMIACVAALLALGVTACGVKSSAGTTVSTTGGSGGGSGNGGGGTSQATPSGTYTITVTASMPGVQHSLPLTLNVE